MLARLSDRKSSSRTLGAILALVMASGQAAQCADQPPPAGQPSGSASTPGYGQPAGSALDQTAPAYGQPAGSALDQTAPAYSQVAPDNAQSAASILDQLPRQPMQPPAGQPFPSQKAPTGFGQNSMQPQPGQPQLNADSIDMTTAVLSRFEMDLDGAQFQNAAVDKLHVLVSNLDMKNGTLSGLGITVKGGQFEDMAFDQLNITTQGALAFDRNQLVNDRVLAFRQPVQAQVTAIVSQDSLNRFLNSPGTLQKLSVTAQQKVHFLASMLGSNATIGVSLSDADVSLEKGNRVNVGVKAQIGMGSVGLPLPLAIDTKLGLNREGWIALSDTHLISNGQEISPLLSNMIVKKFDELTDWQKNGDIQFSFAELKVVPNKQFIVKGTAQIARLHFGQK